MVLSTLERSGLNPALLRLEITESVLLVPESTVKQLLHEIRAHGIHISLDDFGTGYSSLSFLLSLPVDEVKVDRSFVSDMHRNAERREVVRTVVQLGRSLHKRVVAEGVETIEEMEELAALGCDCAQGYLIGKPMLIADLEANMPALLAKYGCGTVSVADRPSGSHRSPQRTFAWSNGVHLLDQSMEAPAIVQ